MKALLFERSIPKFAAARLATAITGGGGPSVRIGPLRLTEIEEPTPPPSATG